MGVSVNFGALLGQNISHMSEYKRAVSVATIVREKQEGVRTLMYLALRCFREKVV